MFFVCTVVIGCVAVVWSSGIIEPRSSILSYPCESFGICNVSVSDVSAQLAVVSSYAPWVWAAVSWTNPQAVTTSRRLELLTNSQNVFTGFIYDLSFREEIEWARQHHFLHLSPLTLCTHTSNLNAEFLSELPPDQFSYICQASLEKHFQQWREQKRQQQKDEEARQDTPAGIVNSWLVVHLPKYDAQTLVIVFLLGVASLATLTFFIRHCCCCGYCTRKSK